jgi:hypothetical protein
MQLQRRDPHLLRVFSRINFRPFLQQTLPVEIGVKRFRQDLLLDLEGAGPLNSTF